MKKRALHLIYLAGFLTFIGYALMHITWRGFHIWKIYPTSAIKLIFRKFGIPLEIIFSSGQPTKGYTTFLVVIGAILLFSGLLAVGRIFFKSIRWLNVLFLLSAIILIADVYSSFIDSKLHYNVPFEYGIRVSIPFLCFWIATYYNEAKEKLLINILSIAIAITFLAHGLYALNILPIPQNFLLMTSNILKSSRTVTLTFLYIAGILDVLLFIGIFIKPIRKYFIYYAIIWGFLTALARLVAYFNTFDFNNYITLWLPEFLMRSGHFLIPLSLLLLVKSSKLAIKKS